MTTEIHDKGVLHVQNKQNPTVFMGQEPMKATPDQTTEATSESNKEPDSAYFHRYRNLKKHHDTEISRARQRIAELESQSSKNSVTPPKTAEELADLQKKNPELYDMMTAVTSAHLSEQNNQYATRLEMMEKELNNARIEKDLMVVQNKHSDVSDILNSSEFSNWIDQQDAVIQGMVDGDNVNASSMVRALDLYKLDSGSFGSNKTKSTPRTTAADAIKARSGVSVGDSNERIWTSKEIGSLSPQEFEAMESEIMLAVSEGRVVQD